MVRSEVASRARKGELLGHVRDLCPKKGAQVLRYAQDDKVVFLTADG